MMGKTKIAWTDYSWNPVTGCSTVSTGCINCYAEKMARRLAGRAGYPETPNHFDVTLRPDRIDQPVRWQKSGRVFVCSMGDLFHEDVPFDFIERAFTTMAACNGLHTFQVLTKRPERMREFYASRQYLASEQFAENPYSNVWLGVSVENQQTADERIPILLQVPAAVRFVSVEPMLGPVDLSYYWLKALDWRTNPDPELEGPGWVIVGCESGPGRRPMELWWAAHLVAQCHTAQVPVFVKQVEVDGKVSRDPAEWPIALQKQEYPK